MAKKKTTEDRRPKAEGKKPSPQPSPASGRGGRKKAGRPAGAKTQKQVIVLRVNANCPGCQSTERTVTGKTRPDLEYGGVTVDDRPYTHVVWRRCICTDCGQVYIEQTFENRPKRKARKRSKS